MIPEAVKQLLAIVEQLRGQYQHRRFTLDGRLVGDLGEVLASQIYLLELHSGLTKHHDATAHDGRLVQIKTTMQNSITFPVDHTPDYLLAIKLQNDGSILEIFNGPGSIARHAVANRKPTKTNLHSIPVRALRKLNLTVPDPKRIPRRPTWVSSSIPGN